MGGFPDSGCGRHRNVKQLPGVCSFCLRDRLSKLTNSAAGDDSNTTTAYYSSLSSSPAYSSASSFSPAVVAKAAVEAPRRPHSRRNGSDEHVAVPLGFLLNEGNGNGNGSGNGDGDLVLKKSRSVGCAPGIYRGGNANFNGHGNSNGNGNGNGEKKRENGKKKSNGSVGFWKRLIHSTSKKTKGVLKNSSTMKERFNDINSSSSRKL